MLYISTRVLVMCISKTGPEMLLSLFLHEKWKQGKKEEKWGKKRVFWAGTQTLVKGFIANIVTEIWPTVAEGRLLSVVISPQLYHQATTPGSLKSF